MKSKDSFYALIAVSALGLAGNIFELFNNFVSGVLIAAGISLRAVFYLIELKTRVKKYESIKQKA